MGVQVQREYALSGKKKPDKILALFLCPLPLTSLSLSFVMMFRYAYHRRQAEVEGRPRG